jgi:hypothetical protein
MFTGDAATPREQPLQRIPQHLCPERRPAQEHRRRARAQSPQTRRRAAQVPQAALLRAHLRLLRRGMMAGIRSQVARTEELSRRLAIQGEEVRLTSRALALRTGVNGVREVKIRWSPENM